MPKLSCKLLTRKNERSPTVIISNLSALKHNVTAALAIPTRWPQCDGEERHIESQTHRLDKTTRNMHTPHTPHPRPKGHSLWTGEVFISLFAHPLCIFVYFMTYLCFMNIIQTMAGTNDYFHYLLICWLFSWIINHLLYKISENNEKWQSLEH